MGDQPTRREQLEAALRQHIAAHGGKDWAAVREKFPDVAERTFWRAVARARSGDSDSGQAVEDARRRVVASVKSAARVRTAADPHFAAAGVEAPSQVIGVRDLALLAHVQRALDDIVMLREYALKPEGGIKNPMAFSQSISLSDRLIQTALKVAESIISLQQQTDFYDAVVSEIAEVDPQAAQRIVGRLAALRDERVGAG